MNFRSSQTSSKVVEHPINTCSAAVVIIGQLQSHLSAWIFEALPYSRFVSHYRSHWQLLTNLLQLKCGSREGSLETPCCAHAFLGKAQLPWASGIFALVLNPCPTAIGLLPTICVGWCSMVRSLSVRATGAWPSGMISCFPVAVPRLVFVRC